MSNYTKTTDFGAKDSLPTGDSGKIIRGTEFETEFDAISTAIATKADIAGPTFTGTLTYETISDGTISITAFVDEDDMSSNSANLVPTQQSVKAYVDAVTTELQAQDLDFQADSGGALSIDLDTETMTFTGGTGIDTSGSGNAVTFAIDSTVATLTGSQTLTNKTLTSPDVNTPDIDGGTIDGTVIGGTTAAAGSFTTVSATSNITVGGTVDGRDVATDGTKLDGIESGATADQTAAEIRTLVESATDSNVFTDADHTKLDGIEANATADQTAAEIRTLVDSATDSNVFTDADHTKLDGIEALADVTDTTNVTAAGAVMDSELTNETAVKSLNQGVATTDSPTFAGLTTTADVSFGDNDKAIFGAGSDLQIYHDGSNSYISDVGTGKLILKSNGTATLIQDSAGGAQAEFHASNKTVKLFYDNSLKLETTSTGIDVTGTVLSDGLRFGTATDHTIKWGSGAEILGIGSADQSVHIRLDPSDASNFGYFQVTDGSSDKTLLHVDDSGDISFYEDTGTTAKLFWDAADETISIGLGASSTATISAYSRTVSANLPSALRIIENTGASTYWDIGANNGSSPNLNFYVNANISPKVTFASSGNVGIGTSSPSAPLNVVAGSNANAIRMNGRSSDNYSELYASSNDGSTNYSFLQGHSAQTKLYTLTSTPLLLGTNSTERMRIDSSGNVLVGTTDTTLYNNTGSGNGGIVLANAGSGAGRVDVARDGNCYTANRLATDGNLFEFMKDGSTVGSIGSSSGNLTVSSSASGKSGIYFGSGALFPMNSGSLDGADQVSFGSPNYQFKDLYLSGKAQADTYQFAQNSAASGATEAIYRPTTGQMAFKTNSAERMRIDSSGNLLVGKTSASFTTAGLELRNGGPAIFGRSQAEPLILNRLTTDGGIVNFNKDGTTVGSIQSRAGVVSTIILDPRSGQGAGLTGAGAGGDTLRHITPTNESGTEVNGKVSLGNSNNGFKDLYLSGTAKIGAAQLRATGNIEVGGYNGGTDYGIVLTPADGSTHWHVYNDAGGHLAFGHSATVGSNEKMRLDSSGNLLVGASSFSFAGTSDCVQISGTEGRINIENDTTSTAYAVAFYNTNGLVGRISTSGSATAYVTSSDQRLKDNIVDAPSASDDIDAIQVRSFDWKADGSHQKYGMVAQELQSVAPEAVSGDADSEDMMGVDYSKLVPMMLKEIQSLRARVAQLEGEN